MKRAGRRPGDAHGGMIPVIAGLLHYVLLTIALSVILLLSYKTGDLLYYQEGAGFFIIRL
jgi:hypothetical protein